MTQNSDLGPSLGPMLAAKARFHDRYVEAGSDVITFWETCVNSSEKRLCRQIAEEISLHSPRPSSPGNEELVLKDANKSTDRAFVWDEHQQKHVDAVKYSTPNNAELVERLTKDIETLLSFTLPLAQRYPIYQRIQKAIQTLGGKK